MVIVFQKPIREPCMRQSIIFALALGLTVTAATAQIVWKQDAAHSQVKFSVSHLVIAEVTGTFNDFDVTLTQKKSGDFAGSVLEATINTASVDTDNERRDKHLQSDDFLNAAKFPMISFKSTSFEKTGEGTYTISGSLTIRDVTKTVVLDVRYNGEVKDPWGNIKTGFKATTSIDRFDYGVRWNKAIEAGGLVAGNEIEITLLLELQKQEKAQS